MQPGSPSSRSPLPAAASRSARATPSPVAPVRTRVPAVLVWLRLARVFHRADHVLQEQLRGQGLSLAQFDVLAQAGRAEGQTQQELADSLLVTKGNVCQLLDRMQAAGLLERRPDGRVNRVFLTDAGRALYRALIPAHEALIAEQFSALSAEEQVHLLTLLRRVDHALRD